MRGRDARPRSYFSSRHMGSDVCRKYRLGYAPGRGALVAHLSAQGFTPQEMIDANVALRRNGGNLADRFYERVMFPIFDERGACVAFGGRIMGDGQPKYLNTAETAVFHKKKNLYAFNWAKEHIVAAAQAVVVEGYTDAIACHEAGIGNVVATLGTALTEYHVKTLSRFAKQIVYLFDGDAAGQKAAERAIQFIEQSTVDLRCVVLPDGMDPMEFITARGGDALRALLAEAEPLMDFVFRKLEERSDTATPGGRAAAARRGLPAHLPAPRELPRRFLLHADRRPARARRRDRALGRAARLPYRAGARRRRRAGASRRATRRARRARAPYPGCGRAASAHMFERGETTRCRYDYHPRGRSARWDEDAPGDAAAPASHGGPSVGSRAPAVAHRPRAPCAGR